MIDDDIAECYFVDRNLSLQAARAMWENLVDLQPQTGGSGGGISRDEFINNVAKDIQVRMTSLLRHV